MSKKKPIKIDGSMLEGGGQILRLTTSLSCLLSKPIKIINIRKNRKGRDGKPKTGLRNQHLVGMKFMKELCSSDFSGGKLHSEVVEFRPNKKVDIEKKKFVVDAITAGSIGLLIQVSYPCLIFGKSEKLESFSVVYKGGTNVDFSPNFEYMKEIFFPMMKLVFNIDFIQLILLRRCSGNTKWGNGKVELKFTDSVKSLNCFTLIDKGKLKKIKIISIVAGKVPPKVAENLNKSAERALSKEYKDVEIEKTVLEDKSKGNFCQIMVIGETTTGCLFGNFKKKGRNTKPKKVINNLVIDFAKNLKENGCVDEYLQDQLIIFMSLAKGKSKLRIGKMTMHTETAIYFSEKMTGVEFEKKEMDDGSIILSVEGIGFSM